MSGWTEGPSTKFCVTELRNGSYINVMCQLGWGCYHLDRSARRCAHWLRLYMRLRSRCRWRGRTGEHRSFAVGVEAKLRGRLVRVVTRWHATTEGSLVGVRHAWQQCHKVRHSREIEIRCGLVKWLAAVLQVRWYDSGRRSWCREIFLLVQYIVVATVRGLASPDRSMIRVTYGLYSRRTLPSVKPPAATGSNRCIVTSLPSLRSR